MTRSWDRLFAWIVIVAFGAAVSGCASGNPQPNVYAYPAKGQTAEQQSRDSFECQNWAKQQTGFDPTTDTAKGAGVGLVIGALGGAAAGAAIGAATGRAGTGAAIGAAAGGLGGAATGGVYNYSKSKEGYDQAYGACMSGRGYSMR
jgi:phage tail tape-measure protein